MPQIFHPSANAFSKASILGAVFIFAIILIAAGIIIRSPYVTQVGVVRPQPVPFSHEHHVAGLGIDCRYCHFTVEFGPAAGMPPTRVCMNCHSQVWVDAPILAPVRDSYTNNTPIAWTRVHDLPDFVLFDHSAHINNGIGCASCHGQVDAMPLMWRTETLHMEWCLSCHRDPAANVRPQMEIFNMRWQPPADQSAVGADLVAAYDITVDRLTDCNTCHQ